MKRATGSDLGALAARARAGDSVARTELLRELYAIVRRHVFFVIGGGSVAEDAVQETMIALYRGLDGFRGDASPKTWAITIASRTARRLRRREGRHVPVDELEAEVFDIDQQAAGELVMLRRALGRLTDKKRDAFVLMSIFELTAEEAGKALGTFANTAASRDRHARAELQEYFDEAGPDVATNTERETT